MGAPVGSEYRGDAGFNLVELLAVIGTLAVLAGMLLPALAKAKERSRSAQCVSNLRQWGLAYRLYADDNEDGLPRRGQGVQKLFQIERPDDWFNALPPYFGLESFEQLVAQSNQPMAKARSVFVCPAATDPGEKYFLPYGMNMNLCPRNLPRATRYAEVILPACVVALADAPGPYASTFPSTRPYSPVPRHDARVALLFLDGRVQAFGGASIGCGIGDPRRDDIRWLTGTESDAQAGAY